MAFIRQTVLEYQSLSAGLRIYLIVSKGRILVSEAADGPSADATLEPLLVAANSTPCAAALGYDPTLGSHRLTTSKPSLVEADGRSAVVSFGPSPVAAYPGPPDPVLPPDLQPVDNEQACTPRAVANDSGIFLSPSNANTGPSLSTLSGVAQRESMPSMGIAQKK